MRVVLAYPHDGHEPDEEIELPDPDARRLIRDGKARPAQGTPVPVPQPEPALYLGPKPPGADPESPAAGEGAQS